MATITLAELYVHHTVDRDVFSRLAIDLRRDAPECLLVMALWLWLEDTTCSTVMTKVVGLSNSMLDALVNEAVLCLKCLEPATPTASGGSMPLTARVIGRDVSMHTISKNKYTAISGVKVFLKNVCTWIFTDILMQVLPAPSRANPSSSLTIPGFPHPVFGSMEVFARPSGFVLPVEGLWGWKLTHDALEDDRTVFLTFSRGFPVSENEVRQLFHERYGDCIESIEMEEAIDNAQPLFARMILTSVSNMDQILNGERTAKFQVNGKHVWARKFERRESAAKGTTV